MSHLMTEPFVGLQFEKSALGGVSRVRGFGIQEYGYNLRFGFREFKPPDGTLG